MIPLSVPNLSGNELSYVKDAVQNGWVSTAGSYVERFEHEMEEYLKVPKTVALQSGTAAIHLALILADVMKEDEVIVPTLTFIAAVNPIKYVGAEPIFMDCDDSLNIDCDKLEDFLKKECIITSKGLQNIRSKRIIKALIVVHVFGNMANLERLREITWQYEIRLIEDATEALGTYYTTGKFCGKFAGSIGDFGAFSFNGNKIITTGGGGMLTARDSKLVEKARYLATQAKDDSLYYVHNVVGYNYRMTNVQAAIGVAQLEQLEAFIQVKTENYKHYESYIKNINGLSLFSFNERARNNHWFYTLLTNSNILTRDVLIQKLKERNIETRPIWKLIHTQSIYEENQAYFIEKAYTYWNQMINIPCSSNLSIEEIDYVIKELNGLYN